MVPEPATPTTPPSDRKKLDDAVAAPRSAGGAAFWMATFMVLAAVAFSLLGFILGIWADGFERLQIVPLLIITPLTFLGGTFYSVNVLPGIWRTVALFNPVVYLVNGLRWTFYGAADVSILWSAGLTVLFLVVDVAVIAWIFRTGWRLRT